MVGEAKGCRSGLSLASAGAFGSNPAASRRPEPLAPKPTPPSPMPWRVPDLKPAAALWQVAQDQEPASPETPFSAKPVSWKSS